MAGPVYCGRHPGARAGWTCEQCGQALCPGCTYLAPAGTGSLPACGRCGSLARPILAHRREQAPFPGRVLGAFAYPFHAGGLLSLAGLALVMWLLRKLGALGSFLSLGVYWAFLFHVIVRSSRGSSELEAPDFSDFFDDLVFPALRGIAATALVWAPALGYVAWRSAREGHGLDVSPSDPVLWLVLLAGWAYVPAAVMVGACGRGLLGMLSPHVVIASIVRLGWDYALAALAVGALVAADLAILPAVEAVAAIPVPVLAGWASLLLALYLPVVAARILGLLLHVRGDDVGLAAPGDHLEPVLAGAVPKGRPPEGAASRGGHPPAGA